MKFRPGVVLVTLAAFLCLFLVVQSAHIGPTPRWQGWENAIPDKLFKMMFDDLKAIARYESSLPVLKNNKKHTRWWPVGKRPKIVLEEVMLRLRDMVNPGSTGRPFAGFEWWSQVVPAGQDGPIGFHLDKDESVASNKHYLLHAEWNSIFYMTDVGGCTLVLDQHSPTGNGYEPAHPEEGDLICPRSNRYLIFNGTLLHGVLPGRPEHVDDAKRAGEFPKEGNRITFLINWWYQKPEGPNCELLPYKEVPGLRLLSKKQLKRLREEVDASVTEEDDDDMPEHARSFFMDLSDSNPDRPPTYWHKYDLPGENSDRVRLPLKLQRGGVYSFNWKTHPKKQK